MTETATAYVTTKFVVHRHDFRLVLELDKLYFKCECCKVRLTILEVERMLNQ
jgi:hypothetical protein